MDSDPTKQHKEIKDLNGLAYWIGSVDTTLTNLSGLIQDLIKSEDSKWDEFRQWRDTVNLRLADGAKTMAHLATEIAALKEDHKSLKDGIHEHVTKQDVHITRKSETNDKNLREYVSWTWIRDKILVPVIVWGIIILLGYLVVNSIQLP